MELDREGGIATGVATARRLELAAIRNEAEFEAVVAGIKRDVAPQRAELAARTHRSIGRVTERLPDSGRTRRFPKGGLQTVTVSFVLRFFRFQIPKLPGARRNYPSSDPARSRCG
jgi:hypothetical protein